MKKEIMEKLGRIATELKELDIETKEGFYLLRANKEFASNNLFKFQIFLMEKEFKSMFDEYETEFMGYSEVSERNYNMIYKIVDNVYYHAYENAEEAKGE